MFFTNVKKTNILNLSLALFAVCKGARWGPSLWRTHGEIPFHWFANDDDDDDDDHDDWWWWSLCSRWLLTTFFFHRKTASWPPSPGGFWPTMFFSLVIFGQRSFFVSIFLIDVKVGWFFFPHCLKKDIFTVYFLICAAAAAIEDIKKVFTQGPYGVHQAYWVCQNWQRVEVPIILR